MATKRRSRNVINNKKEAKSKLESNSNLKNTVNEKKVEEKVYKNIFFEYLDYYKNRLMKKNVIIFIISIILFSVLLGSYISNLHNEDFLEQIKNINLNEQSVSAINNFIKNKVPTIFIIILAGITPYFFISILGIFTSTQIANEILSVISVANNTGSMFFMCIGAMIQLVGFSLATSTGIHWCRIMTKRSRYFNGKENMFDNLRQEYYRLRNNNKKIEELKRKKKEKNIKNEKNNVKIPYKILLISFLFSCIIVFVGTIIFYI